MQNAIKINIDLRVRVAFACDKTYVALSQCEIIEGIILSHPIHLKDVKVNFLFLEFFSCFGVLSE